MSVETKSTLKETFDNVLSKNGAVFFALFSFSSLLFFIAIESRAAATGGTAPLEGVLPTPFVEPGALAVPMPRMYAVLLAFMSLFIGCYFAVPTTRVFVRSYDGIPRWTYTEDIGSETVHMFLGTLAFAPLFIGGIALPTLIYLSAYGFELSLLLVVALLLGVPTGAFVAVTFAFYVPYTTFEGEGFIEAFNLSWNMTSDNRLSLCGFFLVFLFVLLVSSTVGLGAYVLLWEISTLVAQLMLGFGAAVALVFTLSLVATIYRKHHEIEKG